MAMLIHSTPIGFDEGLLITLQVLVHASGAKPREIATCRRPAESPCQPPTSFRPRRRFRSSAIAYMEMPEENTVITAKEIALSPRVFSSKRSFRYSGTDRAREP